MSEAYNLLQKGLAALAAGLSEEAIVPLERAKRLEPNSGSISEALGLTYFRLRFYDRALAEFETILEREPLDDYAHFCTAKCHDRMANFPMASRHYKLAQSLRPERELYRDELERFLRRQQLRGGDGEAEDQQAAEG